MADRFFQWVIDNPRRIYAGVLLLTLALGALIPRIQIDTDPENMLPADNAARMFHNEVKQRFDLKDAIVVGAVAEEGIYTPESLAAMHSLTRDILKIDGVVEKDLMALSEVDNIRQDGPGVIRFEWMMRNAPQNQLEADRIAESVSRLPMLQNTLVSGDGKAAAIYVPIEDKNESYRIAEEIRTLFAGLESGDTYHLTGLPVAEDQFGFEMFVQMGISAPMAGAMIFVLMLLFFRNLPLVLAPMAVAMATVISTMGLLIGMGFTVHIMSSMIAIFLMPIAVVDSVHILSEFADRYRPGRNVRDTILEVMKHLFMPMLFTSVTSAVGFLSLMLTPIPPVQIFGAFVAFGILLAFILTIVFVPAYIVRVKPETLAALQAAQHRADKARGIDKLINPLGALARNRQGSLLVVFASVLVFSVVGITKIQINDNPINWFKQDHELRIADRALNSHFAGTYDAYLVMSAPENLAAAEELNRRAAEIQADDFVFDWQPLAGGAGFSAALDDRITQLDDALFDAGGDEAEVIEQLLALAERASLDAKVMTSPDLLNWMANLQGYLEASGLVGKSNGLPQLVKTVNRELVSGKSEDYRIPATPEGVAQTLLQYQSSHRPGDLWHFVTPDYRSGLLWLQLTSGDNQHMSAVMDTVDDYIGMHPAPVNVDVQWAGKAYLNSVWQDQMVAGMMDSLASAFLVVLVMMIALFRSVLWGLLAMLPLTLTIGLIYGMVGWLGIDYDMPIAVLSALTLGLSVDFAIHFIERFRSYLRKGNDYQQTLSLMFDEPARAISRNALVVALGFTPLLFAPLVPYVTVGIFLASIMATSALVTLLLLPAGIWLLQRWLVPAGQGKGQVTGFDPELGEAR
ncbi:efflux RND transporter permease subunit [Biformimicrobium ophioploci]|uniref:SSD domain-containing protein n=1 Tax=Biformimicrobium ophioploci TaxID=3036711 RepID=A0ABQ6LZS4_9GAMM|nr:MMPL family transporter [Microbulbifer sp. NKW57]GMG87547.1 hypothetical protein MNKW57_18680 [Microbulbifer sp. NKW57]